MSQHGRKINTYLRKLQQGDKTQFDLLYKNTANHLRIVALKYTVNKCDVDDVVEEAFFRAYTSIASFHAEKDGFNWLCKIVQNVAYDFNKVYKKDRENLAPLEDVRFLSQSAFSAYDEVLERLQLAQAFEKADATDKTIFYLRFYENATEREIAQKVGLSNAGVHKRIKKILHNVKNLWRNGKQKP